jgi:hypothetical protein
MEVGKMPAQRKTNQSRGLTAAGLIAVTAATLLMMAWAIFPTAAFANGTITWDGVQGLPEGGCPNGAHWILSPAATITSATLHVGNQTIQMSQNGPNGSFSGFSSGPVTGSTSASADYVGTASDSTSLKVSGCVGGTTTATTTTATTTTATTTTATTTTPTTTPATTTTTTPGGGGGTTTAPTTTTTTSAIVAPTTVHNTSTTATAEVLPTTVRPGKLAFTGIEDVVPIGALALTLMTTGSGLLWAGSRRRRHDGSEDED